MKATCEFVKRVIDASDGNQSMILIEEIQKDARRNLKKELARIKACNTEGDKLVVQLKSEISQLRAKLSGKGFYANNERTIAIGNEQRLICEKMELKLQLAILRESIQSLARAEDHDDLAIRVLELTSRFQK